MESSAKTGFAARLQMFYRLVRRLRNARHDNESLEIAQTILDRSVRPFAADPSLEERSGVFCGWGEFSAVARLLKATEGPDGAALDGAGLETEPGRRLGGPGMILRRQALTNAAETLEHFRERAPAVQAVFSSEDTRWRWRESGWPCDALIFQPLVVLMAPSRGFLERSASVLEQLCSPSPIPERRNEADAGPLRAPYAAAVLLDTAGPNPPEVLRFVRQVIALRRQLSAAGCALPEVELIALSGDPVTVCLPEWVRSGGAVDEFPRAWENAVAGKGGQPLESVYRAAIHPEPARQLAAELTGHESALLGGEVTDSRQAETHDSVRMIFSRFESLHRVAKLLWNNAPFDDADNQPMDRARQIDQAKLYGHGFSLDKGAVLAAEAVNSASAAPVSRLLFSEEERSELVRKWTRAEPPSDDILYVFPHIPKTAGSSVHFHLKTHLLYDEEYVYLPIDYSTREELQLPTPFTLRDRRERRRVRILFGHGVIRRHADFVPGKTVREITTLRDPAERTLSHYNFWMNVLEGRGERSMSFDEWYATEPRNYHLRWMARKYLEMDVTDMRERDVFAAVKKSLESFWMVCTISTFEQDIQRLFDALSLPPMQIRQNVGGVTHAKRFDGDDALRQRLIEENAYDYELYRLFLERAQARHREAGSGA